MSQYLVDRLYSSRNVAVETGSKLVELRGGDTLEAVTIEDAGGQRATRSVCGIFVMIGADPSTEWLGDAIRLDDRRFVLTSAASSSDAATGSQFATSLPGVFAVGDVRSSSVKRVASAVGEGAQAISAVHGFLAASGYRVSASHAHSHAAYVGAPEARAAVSKRAQG